LKIIKLPGLLVIIVSEVFFELNMDAQEQSIKTIVANNICVMCLFIKVINVGSYTQERTAGDFLSSRKAA